MIRIIGWLLGLWFIVEGFSWFWDENVMEAIINQVITEEELWKNGEEIIDIGNQLVNPETGDFNEIVLHEKLKSLRHEGGDEAYNKLYDDFMEKFMDQFSDDE